MNKKSKSDHKKSTQSSARRKNTASRNPRHVEHYWNFYKKDLYVSKPISRLPAWLLPLLTTLLIIALVFWGIPQIIIRLQNSQSEPSIPNESNSGHLYGPETRVVVKPVADVFDQPDLKADRLTQVLYHEAVTKRDQACPPGFIAVRLQEGVQGYMMTDDLTDDSSAIEPSDYPYRAIVTTPTKRIMSHAEKGTLLIEVMMGTQLFIDYRGAGVSSVQLSGGSTGWISDDGVVILPALQAIEKPYHPADAFCDTAFVFLQATALERGLSVRGISVEGIIHLSALINGLNLPRTIDGLLDAGQSVTLVRDPDNNQVDLSRLQKGDLVFFEDQTDQDIRVGLFLESKQIIYIPVGKTSVRLVDLEQEEQLWSELKVVRRIFP